MIELVRYLVQSLVDHPDDVEIMQEEKGKTTVFHVKVNPKDLGRVIGAKGRNANAMRVLLRSVAETQHRRAQIEIVETDR